MTTTVCPKCGYDPPAADECPRCGIVFAKYRPRAETPTPAQPAAPVPDSRPGPDARPRPGEPMRKTGTGWLLLLLIGVSIGAYFEIERRAGSASSTGSIVEPTPPSEQGDAESPSEAPSSPRAASPRASSDPAAPSPQPASGGGNASDRPAPALPPGRAELRPPYRYPHTWLRDSTGYRTAVHDALDERRLVTLYVYTDWCPYCRRLEDELLTTGPVRDCLARTVKVRVNPEHGPADRAVADRFGVTGYPSLFFFDPATGRRRKLGTYATAPDGEWRLMTPAQFTAVCNRGLG